MARTGRPKLPAGKRRGDTVGLRVTSELRRKLDAACKKTGNTRTREIERRLEESFSNDAIVRVQFGHETYALFMIARHAIRDLEKKMGKKWFDDAYAHKIAVGIVNFVMQAVRPEGEPVRPNDLYPSIPDERLASARAADTILSVLEAPGDFLLADNEAAIRFLFPGKLEFFPTLKRWLGHLTDRLEPKYGRSSPMFRGMLEGLSDPAIQKEIERRFAALKKQAGMK